MRFSILILCMYVFNTSRWLQDFHVHFLPVRISTSLLAQPRVSAITLILLRRLYARVLALAAHVLLEGVKS